MSVVCTWGKDTNNQLLNELLSRLIGEHWNDDMKILTVPLLCA